jgi:small subunit ribosomal protein S7
MRKARAKPRIILPDPKYNEEIVTKFVNSLMFDGKKNTAFNIFYNAMEEVEKKTGQPAMEVFKNALNNVMPTVEVKSRRVGGATFQVPTEVKPGRRQGLGIRWILKYAAARNGRSMQEKLAAEIMAAHKGEGAAVKKKEDTHKMAEANKAFSHFKF